MAERIEPIQGYPVEDGFGVAGLNSSPPSRALVPSDQEREETYSKARELVEDGLRGRSNGLDARSGSVKGRGRLKVIGENNNRMRLRAVITEMPDVGFPGGPTFSPKR